MKEYGSWAGDSVLMLNEEVARDLQNLGIEICSGSLTHSEGLKSCPWNFNCKGFEEENWMSFKVSSWSTWSLSVWEAKPLKVGDEEPLLSALPPCKKKNRNGKGKWRKWRSRNTEAKPAQAWFWSTVASGKWWKSDERINSKSTQLGGHCTISMLWRTRVLNFFISQLDARHNFKSSEALQMAAMVGTKLS